MQLLVILSPKHKICIDFFPSFFWYVNMEREKVRSKFEIKKEKKQQINEKKTLNKITANKRGEKKES